LKGLIAVKSRMIHLKPSKYPLSRISDDRIEELNQILHNSEEITIYCDCSVIHGHPIVGLSACFVGCGSTILESRKIYSVYINKTIYLEFRAVRFALENLPRILEEYKKMSFSPSRVLIYSDTQVIEDFVYNGAGKKAYMREVIAEIRSLLDSLPENLNVQIRYLGEHKKQNIFYKASHNSARKVIGKK